MADRNDPTIQKHVGKIVEELGKLVEHHAHEIAVQEGDADDMFAHDFNQEYILHALVEFLAWWKIDPTDYDLIPKPHQLTGQYMQTWSKHYKGGN